MSDTEPTETTVNGKPVVWIDTSATPTADTTAPSAVTGLTAGTPTETTVPLSWTAATDNTAVTGYEYSLNGTTWTSIGSTGTTYTVTGLTQGTAYTIQVRAFDAAGNRGTAASVAATTAASADTTAPTAPTNLAGTAGTTTMDLSWTASTDAVGVTGYRVSKDNGATWITSAVTGTTYQVTGLTTSTSYTFAVAARDAAGNWSTNATLVKSTNAAAPAIPSGAYGDVVTPLAPTNYLALGESSGTTTVSDLGSAPKTWIINSPFAYGAAGLGDGATAANFGGNGFLSTSGGSIFSGDTAGSFAVLIKPTATSSGISEAGGAIFYIASGKFTLKLNGTAFASTTTLVAGTRYHLGATWDGTNVKLYINGALDATIASTLAAANSGGNANIGLGNSTFLNGVAAGFVTKKGAAFTAANMLSMAQAAGLA